MTNRVVINLQMPSFTSIQALSISDEPITSICFDNVGKSLAIGCASLGQLLVWDWQSETYMLKQQGHFQDITCLAYSPDGAFIATGADDAKVCGLCEMPNAYSTTEPV